MSFQKRKAGKRTLSARGTHRPSRLREWHKYPIYRYTMQLISGAPDLQNDAFAFSECGLKFAALLPICKTYETGLSWETISANQASSSDRWSDVISVKARPIPNLGSQ
jgi:hypothetical protein